MIEQSIAPFLGKHHITIGILKEHNDQYKTAQYLEDNYPNQISVVILENRTKGPADTVYQIIQQIGFDAEPILVKDCDSFFDYPAIDENAVCVARVEDYEIIKRLSSKSFIVSNDQGIIIDIIEKQVSKSLRIHSIVYPFKEYSSAITCNLRNACVAVKPSFAMRLRLLQ